MWPLVVVNPEEGIEAFLLLQEVESGGLSGIGLKGAMHTFVTAVLFGVPRVDALDLDT